MGVEEEHPCMYYVYIHVHVRVYVSKVHVHPTVAFSIHVHVHVCLHYILQTLVFPPTYNYVQCRCLFFIM